MSVPYPVQQRHTPEPPPESAWQNLVFVRPGDGERSKDPLRLSRSSLSQYALHGTECRELNCDIDSVLKFRWKQSLGLYSNP